ncbi:hypothetical protein ONE63_004677 [Megalurothrips usitatus]|uniref:Uncharacterized protein n=1 Tax=Megalurothrips usitatus TaxID=439358 RepID=A0AAV7X0G2_9NEOP|nr:hypothetical protein ONE63_004677 [Megalurothrips usitatus]
MFTQIEHRGRDCSSSNFHPGSPHSTAPGSATGSRSVFDIFTSALDRGSRCLYHRCGIARGKCQHWLHRDLEPKLSSSLTLHHRPALLEFASIQSSQPYGQHQDTLLPQFTSVESKRSILSYSVSVQI